MCVCASKRYRATDLATGTSEGTGQVCVWQGDMTRALDVSVCVWGRGWGRGRQRPNYRGRTTRRCGEKERSSYGLRKIGRHPYITEGREIGRDRERERGERGREREGEG